MKGDIHMSEKVYGIDMGTNSIKIYQKSAGVIVHQKNMIAMVKKDEPLALGDEAYSMYEKAPKNISVKKPIVNGVIADFTAMQIMIQLYFRGSRGRKGMEGLNSGGNSEFLIAVPHDITDVEKRAFYDLIASSSLKSRKILLVEKPIADALGAGLNVMDATGRLIVNIGADNPYARDIVKVSLDVLLRDRQSLAHHLFHNAGLAFQSGVDRVYRVALIPYLELGVENLKLRSDLLYSAGVTEQQLL